MANESFPQINARAWWGVRAILQSKPSATVDESTIQARFDVQPSAARQYLAELRRIGILGEEGKATFLANKWRLDESYADAVNEIVSKHYPDSLISATAPGGGLIWELSRSGSWPRVWGMEQPTTKLEPTC